MVCSNRDEILPLLLVHTYHKELRFRGNPPELVDLKRTQKRFPALRISFTKIFESFVAIQKESKGRIVHVPTNVLNRV